MNTAIVMLFKIGLICWILAKEHLPKPLLWLKIIKYGATLTPSINQDPVSWQLQPGYSLNFIFVLYTFRRGSNLNLSFSVMRLSFSI